MADAQAHPLVHPVIIEAATVLAALKVRPGDVGASRAVGVPADLDRACARRPVNSPVGAKEALRRGRTKEGLQLIILVCRDRASLGSASRFSCSAKSVISLAE